jgi:hypothetical protein
MNIAVETETRQGATLVINFATSRGPSLSTLLADFDAAERLLSVACETDEQYPAISRSVKIFGGIVPASTLIVEGKPPATLAASEWFYRSREDIEREYTVQIEKAMPAGERLVIEDHFVALRKECTRQLRASDRQLERASPRAPYTSGSS